MARVKVIDKAMVDGKLWYTIFCNRDVESWIRSLDNSMNCYQILGSASTGTLIDINEDIYMFAMIKWSEQ